MLNIVQSLTIPNVKSSKPINLSQSQRYEIERKLFTALCFDDNAAQSLLDGEHHSL